MCLVLYRVISSIFLKIDNSNAVKKKIKNDGTCTGGIACPCTENCDTNYYYDSGVNSS